MAPTFLCLGNSKIFDRKYPDSIGADIKRCFKKSTHRRCYEKTSYVPNLRF